MALVTIAEVINAGRFTAGEFNWDRRADAATLHTRVEDWIALASTMVQQAVGSGSYASSTEPMATLLKKAELKLALAEGLDARMMILSSRPEEGPPEEYIDLDILKGQIESARGQAEQFLAPYRTNYEQKAGLGFAFSRTGPDETAVDEYTALDYGDLEDYR
jgi:hypothetical protein